MKNRNLLKSILIPSCIFVAILLLDLLTKHFVFQKLSLSGDVMSVIPGFINFVHVENTGAAWGILAGRPVFLIVFSILIFAIYLAFYIIRVKKFRGRIHLTLVISLGLIAGGCVGNLVDRIAFGYVRDFINFQFIDFPVFNFADVALTFGIILMIIYFFFFYTKEDERLRERNKALNEFKDEIQIFQNDSLTLKDVQSENKDQKEEDLNKPNEGKPPENTSADIDEINTNKTQKD